MTEREDIDKLFHDTLYQQELPVDEQAMQQAMQMLDNKKSVRSGWKWYGAALLLLLVGAGIYLTCSTDKKKTPIELSENGSHTNTPNSIDSTEKNIDSPGIKNSTQTEQENLTTHTSESTPEGKSLEEKKSGLQSDNAGIGSASFDPSGKEPRNTNVASLSTHRNDTRRINEKPMTPQSGKQNDLTESLKVNDTGNEPHREKQSAGNENSIATESTTINQNAESNQASDLNQYTNSNNSDVQNVNSDTAWNNVKSTDTAQIADTSQSNIQETETAHGPTIESDSTNNHEDEEIPPPPAIKGKWDIRLAGSYSYITSKFNSSDAKLKDYVTQRNEQEKPVFGFGFDLSAVRNFNRSNLSFGLGYSKTGENIQYSGKKTEKQISSTTTWDYNVLSYMIVDGTPNGGSYTFDTTFVTFVIDSTGTTISDTNYVEVDNVEVSAHNGPTQLVHIVVPIGYSYRIARGAHSELFITGQIEGDYLIVKRAAYLNPYPSDFLPIYPNTSPFSGDRSFMLNGAIGIEWRKLFHQDKLYCIINPGFKTNLYSWHRGFGQHYYMPYLRVGLGYRF